MAALLVMTTTTFEGPTFLIVSIIIWVHTFMECPKTKAHGNGLIALPKALTLHILALPTLNVIKLLQIMLTIFKSKLIAHGTRVHDKKYLIIHSGQGQDKR